MLPRDVSAPTSTFARKVSLRSRQVLIVGTALICILALGLSFRAGALDFPLDRDEGVYAYIGANLTSGIVPYRDAFDHKPPGIYLFYAAASIGPDKVTSIRLATDVLFTASILLVFAITTRTYGRTAGLVAALAWAALGNHFPLEAERANTEQIMVPFLLGALWSFQKGAAGSSTRWLIVSGLASGIAFLLKQVAVLPALVLLGYLGLRAFRKGNWRRSAREIAAVTVGIALPILATVIYFGAVGALDDLYYAVFRLNYTYVESSWDVNQTLLLNLDRIAVPWAYAASGSLLLYPFLPREQRGWHLLIVVWSLANLAGAKVSLREFSHYYVPVLPSIAILAGAFIWFMSRRAAMLVKGSPWLRPALAITVAAGLFVWQAEGYLDFYFAKTPAEAARVEFGDQGEHLFARSEEVASFIRASTEPEDEILVWAAEAQIYFLAERRAASRFIYTTGIVAQADGIATLRSDLLTRRPKLVVTYTEGSPPYKAYRQGLYELLAEEGYAQRFQAGWLVVYMKE